MTQHLSPSIPAHRPRALLVDVPPLPSIVRYVDDYTDEDYSVTDLSALRWIISINGTKRRLRFDRYERDWALKGLLQAFIADRLTRGAPSTAQKNLSSLVHVELDDLITIIECSPVDARSIWDRLRSKIEYVDVFTGLKALLVFLAERKIGKWRPAYLPFISSALPLPPADKFSRVRRRDVFISIEDEARLVRWIEEHAVAAKKESLASLVDTALIICSYQFAMRPKQIGILRRRDCRIISPPGGSCSVHLTFRMIKQRDDSMKRMPLVRRVKREWAIIFSEIFTRTEHRPGSDYFLGYTDAASISVRIRELLLEVTGVAWSARDLRHSGAMRMVDAGASAEELAEYMGHSSLESGQVYYATSATQVERVNQALGISDTYRQVAHMGTTGFIHPEELRKLKGEQQVAGVPHGIPIAGIGACTTGQPSCPFNPVTACYGCPKFLPISDQSIHQEVLRVFVCSPN
ncbi:tyrosine-type recombinase/integrase [Pseudoduganella sp. RAF53_2]|uniref:tyrosine-type recombinase/integrase n=1 Tax=unclassified Pseudoduganella TaxID=2637179 RepID=UPI003F995055